MCAVADDLPSYVLSGIASYAPKVINWLWNKLSASSLGRKVAAVIPDSSSMNDDQPSIILGNRFAQDASLRRMAQWKEWSSEYADRS